MPYSLISPPAFAAYAAYFFAGILDSCCGGGGLITLPVLMMTGIPTHYTFGTNQCSAIPGSVVSVMRFAKNGNIRARTAALLVPSAVLSAYLGARLNLLLPDSWLQLLMVVLVPVIAVVMIIKKDVGSEDHMDTLSTRQQDLRSVLIALVIGMYQGFYGPGSGTFSILFCALFLRMSLIHSSAHTRLIIFCSMTSAVIAYAASGAVLWQLSLMCALFNTIGSYIGTGLAMTKGAKLIRPMFFGVLALLFVKLVSELL